MKSSGKIYTRLDRTSGVREHTRVPLEVRDVKGVVRQQGLVGDDIDLAPGRYFVTAMTPDGLEWAAADAVDVAADASVNVELFADSHQESQSATPIADAVERAPRKVAVIRCSRWLEYWMNKDTPPEAGRGLRFSLTREKASDDAFSVVPSPDNDTLIEVAEGDTASYFAVPFDEGQGPTRVRIVPSADYGADVQFEFANPTIQELLSFVSSGPVDNARSIARSLSPEVSGLQGRGGDTPLASVIAAYVLLRTADQADQFEKLDGWSSELLRKHGDNLPDALPLQAEVLARLGRHRDVIELGIAKTTIPRLPWFRSGVGYLCQRLDQYLSIVRSSTTNSHLLSGEQSRTFSALLRGMDHLTWAIDDTRSICVFRNLELVKSDQYFEHYRSKSMSVSDIPDEIKFVDVETGARFGSELSITSHDRQMADGEAPTRVDPKRGYGTVAYKIGERSEREREYLKKAILAFTGALPEKFGNSNGTYTITIVVKDGSGKELAKEPILTFQWKNERVFFFIDKVVEQLQSTQWAGTLVDQLLVTDSTRRYRIGVEVFFSNSRAMDFESLKKTSKLFSEGALASFLPLPATAVGVIGAVGEIVDLFYSGSRKETLVEFDEFEVMTEPQTYAVPVKFRDDQGRPWTLPIKIILSSNQSRYMGGPFKASEVTTAIIGEKSHTVVTAKGSAVKASLLDLLRSSDDHSDVRTLLDAVAANKKFDGDTNAACGALYGALSNYLSTYDARSLFWAFVKTKSSLLDQAACLAGGRKEELERLGLTV